MSEQDSMRLVAEVVDKFSGPLKALRAQLQGMSKDGASHTEAVVKGFQKVESAAKSAGTTAATTLNPALAAIGITGLSVVAAMTGVGSALRSLGGSVSALAILGRETGVSAENLRVLQSVMGKFGIEAEASAGAIKTFAQNMRLAKDGIGPIMEFLRTQGKTSEGRAYFNSLADSLKDSKDNGEALVKALEGLEHIQDPAGRMEYAQRLFGNADIGRLGDQSLGRLRDLMKKQRELLGPLNADMVKSAEDFDEAMSSLRTTMQKLGTAIATEAMPHVSEFVQGIEGLVKDGRQDITGPLRQSVREVGEALKSIDWAQAGKDAKGFVEGTTTVIRDLLSSVRSVAEAIRSLSDHKYVEAFRHLDGGSGPLARKLAPLPGDDKIAHDEAVAKARGQVATAREQAELMRDVLKEAEESGDRGKAAQMRGALELNSRRLKDLEETLRKLTDGTATVQQQSFDGTGTGLGGLIHAAGYGGGAAGSMARVGNMLAQRHGRIYAPGGPGASGGGRGPGGGDGFGARAPQLRPGGPGEQVGRWQRGEAAPSIGSGDGANPGDYKDILDHIAKSEGTAGRSGGGYNTSLSYGKFLPGGKEQDLTGKTLDEIDALQSGMLKHPANGFNSSAIGRYQIVRTTLRSLRRRLGLKGDERYDEAMQDRLGAELARARGADPKGLRDEWASLTGEKNRRAVELMRRIPRSASTTPGARPTAERADGEGWADRERARKAFEGGDFASDYRRRQEAADRGRIDFGGDSPALSRALKAGAGGATLNANGSVEVHVARPGPDTKVSTSASGNLFRDVQLRHGKTMAPASQGD